MPAINPYLNFNGTAEEAFNFYRSIFGGEFVMLMRMKDTPEEHRKHVSPQELEKIMHIALPINGGGMLMATDSLESLGQKLTVGNNFYISLSPESREEADRVFGALSQGGRVETSLTDMFWGYFGCFTDKFGIQWMLNVGNNQPS